MANYGWHIQTVKEIVYTLPTPTNWVEVQKTLSGIKADLENRKVPGTVFDDAVRVESDEDGIRFIAQLSFAKGD